MIHMLVSDQNCVNSPDIRPNGLKPELRAGINDEGGVVSFHPNRASVPLISGITINFITSESTGNRNSHRRSRSQKGTFHDS